MKLLTRVLYDDLEFDGDFPCFNGKLFTGIAYEVYPDGKLHSEYEYREGWENNVGKEWYSNGQLKSIELFKNQMAYGTHEKFYEDGSKKSESDYELGIELERRSWSESGELIEHWKLDPEAHQHHYELLLERRKQEAENS